jgi:hypothetical protein
MTTSILDTLKQQLGPDAIQQISQTIGADPAATSSAVSTALPVLLGGLSRNAANPEGAAALDQALGAHDGSILDNLGGLLGGHTGGSMGGGIGGAILGHILGSRRGPVEQGVGQASGLNLQQVGQLLTMLAPIVMGVLGRMKQQGHIDASALPGALQQSTQQAQPGGGVDLNNILDGSPEGGIAGEVASLGRSVLGNMFGSKN